MATPSSRVLRNSTLVAGCIGLAVAASTIAPAFSSTAAATASHAKTARPAAVVPGSRYLALGDSVPFGYREQNSIPAPNYRHAKTFTGYPEDVAANLGLKLTNAACPGETTASFMNIHAQSNGCENTFHKGAKPTPVGYRTLYPLHASYQGSQLAFAEKFLKQHPNTRLVTLMIGANDGFICENKFADGCASEFGALQAQITKNVKKIFRGLRHTAHYQGQIALVTYYSTDYSNSPTGQLDKALSKGLNGALEAAAKPFNVRIANGYNQFRLAAAQGHGSACTAQLLTALSGADKGTCGVHPSLAGAAVLAQAVERAVRK